VDYAGRMNINQLTRISSQAQAALVAKRPGAELLEHVHSPCVARVTHLDSYIRASQMLGADNHRRFTATAAASAPPAPRHLECPRKLPPTSGLLPPVPKSKQISTGARYQAYAERRQAAPRPASPESPPKFAKGKTYNFADDGETPDNLEGRFEAPRFNSRDGFATGYHHTETGILYLPDA